MQSWFYYYLLAVNIITFIVFAVDKAKAIRGQWRVSEAALLGLSLIGGAIGGLFAMYVLHHKTRKPRFAIGLPLMFLAQAVLLFWWIVRTI